MIAIVIMVVVTVAHGKTIYVDDDADGVNNGSSWENAYVYLQDALADAETADKPVEIRVAQGTYTPNKGAGIDIDNIEAAFELINGVTVAGGYAGAADPNARDIELYETILSGDLNSDDEPVADPCDLFPESEQDSRFDNSYNVVTAINTNETAVLDGFIITGGIASEDYLYPQSLSFGGGLFCSNSSPKIVDCTFVSNAAYDGGAIYGENSNPTLINCRFDNNAAIRDEYGDGGSGGAMLNLNSSPVMTGCTFTGNCGNSGGAIYNLGNSHPILTDCRFTQNTVTSTGGGMNNWLSNPILTGCSFEGNSAMNGGGLYNSMNTVILTGCTFIGNYARSDGGGMSNENSETNLTDCTFISNKATSGGAVSNDSCENLVINNCIFTGNSAYQGGGMENWYSELSITNSIFTGNAAEKGFAVHNFSSVLSLTNCTFAGNAAKVYTCDIPNDSNNPQDNLPPGVPDDIPIGNLAPSNVDCVNCIIRDDANSILNNDGSFTIVNYSNISGGFEGMGNIDADPLFVSPGHWADINDPNIVTEANDPNAVWIDGDYHLKSQAGRFDPNTQSWVVDDVTSPCIDAGNPNSPLGDEPAPNGGRINMGAYGGTIEASKSLPDDNKKP